MTGKRGSIRKFMMRVAILQIIVPFLLNGVLACVFSATIVKNQAIRYADSSIASIRNIIKNHSENIFRASQAIIYDRDVFDRMTGDNYDENGLMFQDQIQNVIRRIILSHSEIDAVHLQIADEAFRAEKNRNLICNHGSVQYDEIERRAREKNGQMLCYIDTTGNEVKQIFMARIIYNPYTYAEAGMMIFQINKNIFANTDRNVSGMNEFSAITNIDGKMYVISGKPCEIDISRSSGRTQKNGKLILYEKIEDMGFFICSSINMKWLFKDIKFLVLFIILMCMASALTVLYSLSYIQSSITIPINKLINKMNCWTETEEVNVDYTGNIVDIDILYSRFAAMTSKIKNLINQNYRNKILQKDIEVKMLQAQINPHFLFNTLESINCVAELNDVQEISDMVTALSDILNQNIGRTNELIPVSEEIRHIDSYIYILKMRFEDKINFEKDISPDTENILIPSFVIQPIVENSIYHGIMPGDGERTIRITTRIENNDLMICIYDSGIGMDKGQVKRLNDRFGLNNDEYFERTPHKNIGVENVNRRIRLIYGEEYGLHIDSEKNKYTQVTIRLRIEGVL